MREYLFRGRRIDNKEWIEGYLLVNGEHAFIAYYDNTRQYRPHKERVDPATIAQYTDVRDKNGKRIFEGDVYHQGDRNILYVVEYTSDCHFMGRQMRTKGSYAGLAHWQDRIEVISTIHDEVSP